MSEIKLKVYRPIGFDYMGHQLFIIEKLDLLAFVWVGNSHYYHCLMTNFNEILLRLKDIAFKMNNAEIIATQFAYLWHID